jgi:hypothetical protein
MSFFVDSSQLRELSQNLGRVSGGLLGDADKVLKRGAQNIKNELVADAQASKHFHGMAGSISYDSDYRLGQAAYEIGPDKGRRGGALGNIAYFGTSRGGGTLDLDTPLSNEAPRLEKALGDLLGQIGDSL